MRNGQALIVRDDARLSITFTAAANELKNDALASSGLIAKVNDAESQERAVAAQQAIANVLNLAEKARKACKDPVLDFGRLIDHRCREFIQELKDEQLRLARLVADFQQLEQERVRRAQQAENERLLEAERQKARELAQAETHEAAEAIQARYNEEAASREPIKPIRAEGQRVTQEWEIEVIDIVMLYRHHPYCVKMEAVRSAIKELLNDGVEVHGIRARKVIKAGVTTGKAPAMIEA
jgi:hypothetical protein